MSYLCARPQNLLCVNYTKDGPLSHTKPTFSGTRGRNFSTPRDAHLEAMSWGLATTLQLPPGQPS